MLEKKSSKGNLEKRKNTFLIVGFIIILGLVYLGFEFFATDKKPIDLGMLDDIEIVVTDIDAPVTDPPPPPPPPVQQQKDYLLQVVKNEIEVNTEGLEFPGYDEGDKIPEYEPVHIIDIEPDTPPVDYFPEVMPEPVGGFDNMYAFLTANLQYPENARVHGISGQVVIDFVVEKDGSISNVGVKLGVFPPLDQEAVRVVKMMPKWKPGKQNGKNVRCYFQIPIRFSINQ